MFNTKQNNKNNNGQYKNDSIINSNAVNLIGVGARIEGKIRSDSDIRIDGYVKGNITTKAKIVIGESATINGDISCQNADVSGKITGKISVEEVLTLKNSAILTGDIIVNKFIVEPGAKFNGSCSMGAVLKEKQNEQKEKEQVSLSK